MKSRHLPAFIAACLLAAVPSVTRADEAAAKKALDHWVGHWIGTVVGAPAATAGTAATPAGSDVAWTLNGKFLQGTNNDAAGQPVGVWMMRYDPAANNQHDDRYKVWFFAADGTVSEWKGTWSDADSTMTWSGSEGGPKLSGHTRFSGNKQEWQLDFDVDGKVVSHSGSLEKK